MLEIILVTVIVIFALIGIRDYIRQECDERIDKKMKNRK